MQGPRKHAIKTAATITASGNSTTDNSGVPLKNLGLSANPDMVIVVAVTGAVGGTSPTLQVTLYAVDDAGNKYQLWQGASITATNTFQRQQVSGVIDPNIEVDYTTGGTSPSFAGVSIFVYMSSPDS